MTAKEQLITSIEIIYGIYRDCRHSFDLTLRNMVGQQDLMLKEFNAKGQNWTIEDLDKKQYHYAVREESGNVSSVAATTQGENGKSRSAKMTLT